MLHYCFHHRNIFVYYQLLYEDLFIYLEIICLIPRAYTIHCKHKPLSGIRHAQMISGFSCCFITVFYCQAFSTASSNVTFSTVPLPYVILTLPVLNQVFHRKYIQVYILLLLQIPVILSATISPSLLVKVADLTV